MAPSPYQLPTSQIQQTRIAMPQQHVQAFLTEGKSLPQPPRINTDCSEKIRKTAALVDKIDMQQKLLEKQLETEEKQAEQLLSDVEALKSKGAVTKQQGLPMLHSKNVGSAITEAIAAGTSSSGANVLAMEAPIVLVETPPLLPEEQMEVDHSSECMLQRVGDENSPAMKAAREYELKRLGEVSSHTFDETQSEIRETQSEIKNKKHEREKIFNRSQQNFAMGLKLAKTGSNSLKAELSFANKDLERKDQEIGILLKKLEVLKKKEAALIQE
ncbi:hypothetical protein IE077_002729, partial [Cardiosporidium cionae]